MCNRSAVIGCYLTEDYFLEKEGVFLLLDLLEVFAPSVSRLTLTLTQLLVSPSAV